MEQEIRIVHTLTWDTPEMAGGVVSLSNGSALYLHGVGVAAFSEILDTLNVSITYMYVQHEDAIKYVANNSADVGSLLVVHSEFYTKLGVGSNISYLHPLAREPSHVYFRQPVSSPFLKNTIIRPFTTPVWLAMMSLALVATFLSTHNNIRRPSLCRVQIYFSEIFINFLQLFIARYNLHMKVGHIQLAGLVYTLFSVYMIQFYTAKVWAVFRLKSYPIKSPEDLLKHNFVLGTYSSIHVDRLFSASKETRNMVLERALPVQGLRMIDKVIGKNVKDPRHALLSLPDGFYPQALYGLKYTQELCLVSSFESVTRTPRCPYIRKGSPFREVLNLKILQMIERGLNHRIYQHHQNKFKFKCSPQRIVIQPISLEHMYIGYLAIVVGYLLAVGFHFLSCVQM